VHVYKDYNTNMLINYMSLSVYHGMLLWRQAWNESLTANMRKVGSERSLYASRASIVSDFACNTSHCSEGLQVTSLSSLSLNGETGEGC